MEKMPSQACVINGTPYNEWENRKPLNASNLESVLSLQHCRSFANIFRSKYI